jgi:hypothetical protein
MGYQYSAFISYSWDDEKWAKWLQKRLETYRLPTALQKELPPDTSGKLRVFRDKTDMKQSPQNPTIEGSVRDKLEQSQYLIVICSENAARSNYVSKEIAIFRELGRWHRIIPFVVSGVPNDKQIMEKFPPALREQQPGEEALLAFSVMDIDRETALVKVVATLLNLDQVTLEHREKLRRRRRRVSRGTAAAVLLAVMVLAAVGLYDYYVPHVRYYVRVVERWGMPVGLGVVTKAEMEGMTVHYRVTEHKSEDRTVVLYCNSAGVAEGENKEYYHPDGKPVTVTDRDVRGNIIMVGTYNKDLSAMDFTNNDSQFLLIETTRYTRATAEDTDYLNYRNNITRERYEYDPESGAKTKTLFMAHSQDLVAPASNGVYGIEYVYDADGETETQYYLGKDGQRAPNAEGVSGVRSIYRNNRLVEVTNFIITEEGEIPTYSRSSDCIAIKFTYDARGNRVEMDYYGANGLPEEHSAGYANIALEIDARGFVTKESYFDANHAPVVVSGEGYSIIMCQYDDLGRGIEITYYNVAGLPTCNNQGVHMKRYLRDSWGNATEIAYYGLDGQTRINSTEGYSKIVQQFDEAGEKVLSLAYFDDQDIPCYNTNRVHEIRRVYDDNKLMEMSYYDVDGNLAYGANKCASIVRTYDALGNFSGEHYYDTEGKRCYSDDGNVGLAYVRNEIGTLVQVDYYVLESEDSESIKLDYSVNYEYDSKGNAIIFRYTDATGGGMDDRRGYTTINVLRNEQGRNLGQSYLNAAGEPVLVDGYASYHIEEKSKYVKAYTYYDQNGSLVNRPENFVQAHVAYTPRGLTHSETFFDASGNPVLISDGYAKFAYTYDGHLRTAIDYYDQNDAPVNTTMGCARIEYVYDKFGRMSMRTAYDTQGNMVHNSEWGCARTEYAYDAKGQITQYAYYGADGQLRSEEGRSTFVQ